jgi:hypothetical protein
MGATLVKIALGAEWADLSRPARVLLTHMAVTALDNGERPRLYYAGHDALAEVLFGSVTEGRLRVVRRHIQELIDAGAIELVRKPSPRSNAHYSLTLERGSKTDLRADNIQQPTADQIGPTLPEPPKPNGGPNRSYEWRTKTVRNGGPNRSGTADQIGPPEEPLGTTKEPSAGRPADAIQSLVTSSSQIQKSPYLGEPPQPDEIGIENKQQQDQKRQEEPQCAVPGCGSTEANHDRHVELFGNPHAFLAPPAEVKPDEGKRSRRNYAVKNNYQDQKKPRRKNPTAS